MDPDPTPDPTPFFSDFKDAKKEKKIPYFFLMTYPQAHYLLSKKFNFCQNFVSKSYFASIISEKGIMRIRGSGSGSPTLLLTVHV